MSDVEDEVGGEEEDVIAPPDDTYADEDFNEAAGADDEQAQAEQSYAADEEYNDNKPDPEPEPSRKAAPELDEEPSYQEDFEQSINHGATKMPDEDEEDRNRAFDEPLDDSADGAALDVVAATAGAVTLTKLTSGASRTSSVAGSRPGSSAAAAAPPKPGSAPKPTPALATPKPAGAKPAPAAAPKPAAAPASKPAVPKAAVPAPKPAAPSPPKPAVPRGAPAASKPVAAKLPPAVVPAKPAVPPRNMAPGALPAPAPSSVGVGSGGQKVKLTFTGPPNTARAAPTVKPDYSHSKYEVNKISSDNMKLCNRLVEISRAPPNPAYTNSLSVGTAAATGKLAPANVAAATVNRHRKEDKIAQENLALYKRLQTVKPTPTVNRELLNKDFAKTQAYSDNARKVKAPPPPAAAAAGSGMSASKLAASGAARQPAAGSAEAVYSRPSASGSSGGARSGSGGSAAALAAPPPVGAPDLSTVLEGPEGEASAVVPEPSALEPEYSMDPEFDAPPSQSFVA